MEAADAGRRSASASPEDRSEGNDTPSAPSEFLAEFLSAIMRRQYAEALKYCRLILQYEPHNATARSFYPLLRHKLHRPAPAHAEEERSTPAAGEAGEAAQAGQAGCAGSSDGKAADPGSESASRQDEVMEHSDSETGGGEWCGSARSRSRSRSSSRSGSRSGSAGDRSDLELDSSEALRSSPSVSLSRRTDRTDSASASSCWDSSGSASAAGSRSDAGPGPGPAPDDNGNPLPAHTRSPPLPLPDDVENENAAGDGLGTPRHAARLKSDSASSLRRLRAHFACSIK